MKRGRCEKCGGVLWRTRKHAWCSSDVDVEVDGVIVRMHCNLCEVEKYHHGTGPTGWDRVDFLEPITPPCPVCGDEGWHCYEHPDAERPLDVELANSTENTAATAMWLPSPRGPGQGLGPLHGGLNQYWAWCQTLLRNAPAEMGTADGEM